MDWCVAPSPEIRHTGAGSYDLNIQLRRCNALPDLIIRPLPGAKTANVLVNGTFPASARPPAKLDIFCSAIPFQNICPEMLPQTCQLMVDFPRSASSTTISGFFFSQLHQHAAIFFSLIMSPHFTPPVLLTQP